MFSAAMMRHTQEETGASSVLHRVLWITVAGFAIAIPLYVSPHAEDTFRLPKELLLRAEAVAVASSIVIAAIWQKLKLRSLFFDRVTGMVLAVCAVAAASSTALSANRAISVRSMIYVAACILTFWAVYIAAYRKNLDKVVLIGAAAGMLNAPLAIAQRLEWFSPFQFEGSLPLQMRITALVGNSNDVGASLAVCLIPVAVLAVMRRRLLVIVAASVLLGGVIAANALTALLAVAVGLAFLVLLASRRIGWRILIALIVVGLATVIIPLPLRARLHAMATAARARDYDALTSHRIVPFLAAIEIFRDHPLVGAGPGTFKWLYLPYRLRVEAAHPSLYLKTIENVGEVHSDQLQVLAEEGLMGYAAFLVAMIALGSRTLAIKKENGEQNERAQFVRLASPPLAVCFFLLAATGFPLELSAVMMPFLFFAGTLFRWSADANVS